MIKLGEDYNKVNELLKEEEKLIIEWEKYLNYSEPL